MGGTIHREVGEDTMIKLSRLNGQEFILNADLIETLEATPDTIVSLSNGKKIMVKNPLDDIVVKTIKYRQLCNTAVQVIKRTLPDEKYNPDDVR
jgi:flagellar protein FlbD